MPNAERKSILSSFRVLDLAGPPGQACGRILADWGADVIKVEPPSGDSARSMAPFAGGERHLEKSVFFLQNNTNKRSVVLDLASSNGRETFKKLAATADVVLESFSPGYLDSIGLGYDELVAINSKLVMTSVTPFGQTGPFRHFEASDIVSVAMGGLLFLEGEPGEMPYSMPRYQSWQTAGIHAAYGTLLALFERFQSGRGQRVDVSIQEVMAHQMFALSLFGSTGQISNRIGRTSQNPPNTFYPCRDGTWVHISVYQTNEWQNLTRWIGDPALDEEAFLDDAYRQEQAELVDVLVGAYTIQYDRDEVLRQAWDHRVAAAPVNSIKDFIDDPHVRARRWMVEVEHPAVGRYLAPGPPIRASGAPWHIYRPAPLLGQHSDEVLAELKGSPTVDNEPTVDKFRIEPDETPSPLDGILITDFARVWAGGFGSRHLADFGATMMKLESRKFPDFRQLDRDPNPHLWLLSNTRYAEINRNKQSVTLDLHFEEARDLARLLIKQSDGMIENYAPRAMDRLGMSYEQIRALNPSIVMVRCPGFGLAGPMRDVTSYGGSVTAFAGLAALWGFPDAELVTHSKQVHPDFIAAGNLALATILGLIHRELTGEGQLFEIAQFEAGATAIGQAFLELTLCPDSPPEAWGNRDPNFAPQGVYRCLGDDRWCAISCRTDDEWRSLATLIDRNGTALDDQRFATNIKRRENHNELDHLIQQWTASMSPREVMGKCQTVGVPAGVVATGEDLHSDPHLRSRGYIVEIDHPIPGRLEHPGFTFNLSRTPGRIRMAAPVTGEHTDEVLGSLAGVSKNRLASLHDMGAID